MAENFVTLTRQNPAFRYYAIWAAVLVLKLICMSFITAVQRFRKRVAASPEDTKLPKVGLRFVKDDDDVERIRRAHLNDLENILPLLIIELLFVLAGAGSHTAFWLFTVVGVSRILHTIVYLLGVPTPIRTLCFAIPVGILIYMSIVVIIHFA